MVAGRRRRPATGMQSAVPAQAVRGACRRVAPRRQRRDTGKRGAYGSRYAGQRWAPRAYARRAETRVREAAAQRQAQRR